VRLALLGPSEGDVAALACAVAAALDKHAADLVVYLGDDDASDRVVEAWAELIGASAPLEERVFSVLDADSATIRQEIAREHARRRLERVQALPSGESRTVEMFGDRMVLVVQDKSILDEEDLLPASVIVFGLGEATLRRVGSRVFLCPGRPAKRTEGLLILEEGEPGSGVIIAFLCDADGNVNQRERIESARGPKLRVQGAV
jgi:hypothetical protein